MYFNVIILMYSGTVKPLDRKYKNWIEFYNENIIYMITIHFMFFTDLIDNELDKFMIGWSTIGWTAFLFIPNIILIFYLAGYQII